MPDSALPPLVFATRNANKVLEVHALLGNAYQLLSLDGIGCADELPETGDTLEHNAREKAAYVHERWGLDVFAEDSGLLVRALNDEPGVYSARYAGPQASDADNKALLLARLAGKQDREARFRTVISLCFSGEWHLFQGECRGVIGLAPAGEGGFGYDPLFYPMLHSGLSQRTFAQMSREEKNAISHRGQAVRALVRFLESRAGKSALPT
ncbi:MAG: RdgB/HAM1 family non-canonical purine NTP pyrophosphatase [Bacteroidetes bacterium]|nr:RdgB/HAM1 family non-canonical purine NTP pyrophosphatase [Bacteroidota bacterium]